MFVCAFWLVVLLVDKRHDDRAKRMLSVFMFSAFILYLCHAVFFYGEQRLYSRLDGLYTCCSLSVYPLYYLYIRSLTIPGRLKKIYLLILLPSLLMGVLTYVLYALMQEGESEIFVHQVLYEGSLNHNFSLVGRLQIWRVRLFTVIFVIQIIPVFYYGLKHIRYYNELLAEYYSDMDRKDLNPIRKMLYFFVVITGLSTMACILGRSFFLGSLWFLAIPSISFSVLLFCGGLIGFRQDFTIASFEKDIHRNGTLNGEGMDCPDEGNGIRMSLLKEKLLSLLEDQRLYTQPDLRITDLARRLGSNRAYVSRVINQQLNTNFSDLVNSYRLKHAQKLLLNLKDPLSMEEIAERSGFPSRSTFYRVFQQQLNSSPKMWIKKQL